MTRFVRYARGLMVALAALALTAGVTFAARGIAPAASVATAPTDVTVNVDEEDVDPEVDQNEDEDADQDEDEDADQDEDDDVDQDEDIDQDEDVDQDEDGKSDRPLNHGAYVSEAAHADTPEGFDNHGQWVSSIAKGSDGKPDQEARRSAKAESKAASHDSRIKDKGAGRAKHDKR